MIYKLFCTTAFVLMTSFQVACSEADTQFQDTANQSASDHNHPQEAHDGDNHEENEIIFTTTQAKAAGVMVETLQASDFSEVITVSGSVLPAQGSEATVCATMNGIVNLANSQITEGSQVDAHQELFNISTQVLGDGNPVAAAKAELEAAEKEWERAKILIVDRIISQREYEAARLRYETAWSTSHSMGNGHRRRPISAPMKGYVQNLLVRNGDFVSVGQPLAVITENKKLRLRAEVPERYYSRLKFISGANFRLTYHAENVYELEKLNGHLLSAGATDYKGEGFLPVTFEFNNPGDIVTGSMAEIYLLGGNQPNTISIPTSALTEELGLYYVYVQTSDHSYQKQLVKKGENNGSRTKIVEGLKAGDRVVTQSAVAVKLAANAGMIPDPHAGHNH